MSRTRMVRKVNETGTNYEIYGYFLSEKAKKDLVRAGVKTQDNTWYDVFPNADVVYRFNPKKNKSDIFVGEIKAARYPSGKYRATSFLNESIFMVTSLIPEKVADSHFPMFGTFTISPEEVRRKPLRD
jgi:hypothetical protein